MLKELFIFRAIGFGGNHISMYIIKKKIQHKLYEAFKWLMINKHIDKNAFKLKLTRK